jgi:hypothetical protein
LTLNNLSPYGIGISFSIFIGVGLVKQFEIILDVINIIQRSNKGYGWSYSKINIIPNVTSFWVRGDNIEITI